jgi:Protein of unknown function (DUF5818)
MKRRMSLTFALIFLSAASPGLLGQELKSQLSPVPPPSEILGPQLVAWSQLQKPQPIPQPVQSPGRTSQQPEQLPVQSASPTPQPSSPAAQTFTGTIVKAGDKYILKASGTNVYELDDQERAKQYEGKQVKIAGSLGATGNMLHVTSIELLS